MARAPKTIIRTINRCIYCGTTEGRLSEEHIIPYSLGANLTLAAASCVDCAKKTSAIELHIARPIAGMLRTRLGIQTRNPDKRVLIPKMLFFDGEERVVQVDPADFPSVFSYPIFGKPGILEGRPRTGQYRSSTVPWSLGQDAGFKAKADAFQEKYGCSGFELAAFRPATLMAFVAKVGHAAAIALLGPDGFSPLVQEAVLNPDVVLDDLLGGQGGAFRPNPDILHAIEIRQIEGAAGSLIFARLWWFACLAPGPDLTLSTFAECGPPPLLAVVGRPLNDNLVGKVGQIAIHTDGRETFGVHSLSPVPQRVISAPSMRPI